MGVIKRGILGGFGGKVANVIGGSWKGIAYMRSMPLSVANPDTAKQQDVRGRFVRVTACAKAALIPVIRPIWNRAASRMSGFNLFQQSNTPAFDKSGILDANKFNVGIGNVATAPILSTTFDSTSGKATVDFTDNSGAEGALSTDKAVIGVYNETANQWDFQMTADTRASGSSQIDLTGCQPGDACILWLSFYNAANVSGPSNNGAGSAS